MGRKHLYPPSVRHGIPHLGRLPRGWIKTTFGEQLRVVERPVALKDNKTYQLISAKRNRGGIVARETLRGDQILTAGQYEVEAGDFITSNRQIIHGACGIVPRELDGAVVSGEYTVMHARSGLHLPFFAHYTHGDYFQKSCFFASVGVDVEKMIFDVEQWLKLPFHLPPFNEQRVIARILADVDAQINANRSVKEQSDGLLAVLFQRLQSKVKKSPVKLGSLCTFEYGEGLPKDFQSANGHPVIGSGGVMAHSTKPLVDGPGIVIGRKGSVGAIHWAASGYWPIDTAYYVVAKRSLNLRWLFWALNFASIKKLASATGVPGLNRDDAYNLNIELCSASDQSQIAQCLDSIADQSRLSLGAASYSEHSKDLLGNSLFTGARRVKT